MGNVHLVAFWFVLLIPALLLVSEGRPLRCTGGLGCLHQESAPPEDGKRKVLDVAKEIFEGFRPSVGRNPGDKLSYDLRWVPSGPDPLHHNGSPPKKPRTP